MADQKVNILLVDDRPENLLALEAVLSDVGQNLVKAGSGSEALKHVLKDDFAVILLDVQMPEMDGFQTAALIRSREKSRHTPIIFVTAINKSQTHVSQGYSVGAVDYVFKPFEPETLKSKVITFVELSKKTKELEAEVAQRQRAEAEVRKLNEELERRVSERTAELFTANRELEAEIAERKQLEVALQQRAQELAEADRRKDEFLAMLAHELRNPLAPICNAVKVLQLIGPHDPALVRARDVMERQLQHMSRLVDDLLDVSRITRGRIELRKERTDLAAIAAQAVETAGPAIAARRLELTASYPPDALWLEADPTRLEQVLTNLLNNAIKYTEPGGQLWVTVERELSTAVIRIRDTGLGIAPEMLPCIFDLFTQADRSLDRARGGLGLGLTLVRRLVEMHGGSATAYSDGPGQGSEFVVRLPVLVDGITRCAGTRLMVDAPTESKSEVSPSEPSTINHQRSTRRVLVVDDNVDAAETLAELLHLWECDVRVAYDGSAAIELAARFQPEVVLLDIGLPGIDGYQVARRLRAQEGVQNALLIAVTGYGQEQDRNRSREATLDHHLTKPIDPEALRQLLARPLEGRPRPS